MGFDLLQSWLERVYGSAIAWILRYPWTTVIVAILVCIASFSLVGSISKTFIPAVDSGEFAVDLELSQGTNLPKTDEIAQQVDGIIRSTPEVLTSSLTVGGRNGESNVASIYVRLKGVKERSRALYIVKE